MQRDIVVIGGSSGALEALRRMLPALPPDLPASIFVTTHLATNAGSYVASALQSDCLLPVSQATHGEAIEAGHVYVAAPGRHLMVEVGRVRLGSGPRENMARPAVDPLFRSAALAYGPRVLGIVLSGGLDDGASGLEAIKRCGGLTAVQEPEDAETRGMPRAALATVQVDYRGGAEVLGRLIVDSAMGARDVRSAVAPPADLAFEVAVALGLGAAEDEMPRHNAPSPLTCPDCHGVLSEPKRGPLRYRCQTGHAFNPQTLLQAQEHPVLEALTVALRIMMERRTLVLRLADEASERGHGAVERMYRERLQEYQSQVEVLRRAVTDAVDAGEPPQGTG